MQHSNKEQDIILSLRLRGETLLEQIKNERSEVSTWRNWLYLYEFTKVEDDPYIWLSCILALQAVSLGNYGVGAVITDVQGRVVAEGQNKLLKPYLRTDRHAEMMALDIFEDSLPNLKQVTDFSLYTSLECCPMCTVRLINTGIRRVLFAAEDPECGMVSQWNKLPPFWQQMAKRREPPQFFGRPSCNPELINAAGKIFALTESELSNIIAQR
ncbi:nucleoside deaminase [Waterburya agarophytonicola K14]|uniref:Nucleoside deaminase n=1 Tax=Waterburya agarophytonicola KI4 TaxID=2874699 RepID=A0A964FGW9_9CYAN|nr:nucleoside deaminase [Waterburya agarophytonicola]MCC0178541.1 nucleoside deaminase [Waterburya agarophytonicola KI4]